MPVLDAVVMTITETKRHHQHRITIPQRFLKKLRWRDRTRVFVTLEKDRLIVEAVVKPSPEQKELAKQLLGKNQG